MAIETIELDSFLDSKKNDHSSKKHLTHTRKDLPDGWESVKLEDAATIVMGQSPPSSTYNDDGVGLPFYQGKADFGAFYPTPGKWCSNPSKVALKNDILISVRAPVGPANLCKERSCIGRGLAVIRPKNMDYKCLFFYLRSRERELMELGKGSTFGAIKRNDLKNFRILVPPLQEQSRIAARVEEILSRIEEIRKQREEAIDNVAGITEAASHNAFFGSEANRWEHVKLGRLLKEDRKLIEPWKHPEDVFWVLTMDCVESNTGSLVKRMELKGKETRSMKYSFGTSHILYGKLRPYLNKVFVPSDGEGVCTTEFIPFLVTGATKEYVAHFLRTKNVVSFAMSNVTGTRQPRASISALMEYPIPLPPIEQQEVIVNYLNAIQERIAQLRLHQQMTSLEIEALPNAVMRSAFDGEL